MPNYSDEADMGDIQQSQHSYGEVVKRQPNV